MIDLDELWSFAIFAEHRNFTRASELLHISQPALHVKIRKLADQLQVPLYRRIGRRLELTEQGKKVAAFGREMRERSEGFVQALVSGEAHQPVVLAAGEGAFLYLLGQALRRFAQGCKVPPRLLTLDGESAVEAVRSGKAHLGVASLETIPDGMEASVLARVQQSLVLPARHPLASRKEDLRLTDLEGSRLIVPPPGRPHRVMLSRALQSANIHWEVSVEAGGWELMIQFVRLGMGLAVVNDFCRIPAGLVARPLKELPSILYHVFHLRGALQGGLGATLKSCLLKT